MNRIFSTIVLVFARSVLVFAHSALVFARFVLVSMLACAYVLAFTAPALADRVPAETYSFPALANDFSTFYSACLSSANEGEEIAVSLQNRRVEGYRKYRSLKLALYRASVNGAVNGDLSATNLENATNNAATAPTVFILSGLGGDEKSNVSRYLAAAIQKMGFNAVIVPNTLTANFVVSTSTSALAGLTGSDAKDLYAALAEAAQELSLQGLNPAPRYLLGYSHGGLLASYVSALDQEQKLLNFKSTLLINPPVDLLYGLRLLDSKAQLFKDISLGRLIDFVTELQGKVKNCAKTPDVLRSPSEFIESLEITIDEAAGLIGRVFKASLKDLILATEAINDHGFLPEAGLPGSAGERHQNAARSSAAGRFNFETYVEKVLMVYAPQAANKNLLELSDETSLPFSLQQLAENKNVFLMHNADDFLLRMQDLAYLESYFGSRARIYPYGGHLGNLGEADNLKAIENWLKFGRVN